MLLDRFFNPKSADATPPLADWLARPLVRLLWCLLGAGCGIALALYVAGPRTSPFLLASLGGSAVFLFGLTRAPAAQPRALLGGHLGGALIGIACYQALGDVPMAYVLAQVLGLAFMLVARCVHPPAGANPILMVHVHANWAVLFTTVLPGVLALVAVALVWSRLYPGLSRYPVKPLEPSPPHMNWGGWGTGG
ncbi:HPP family protein [Roseateles asaccharophilus]|uniref:CBS-domain-containing membrane protein n=1 Tax=Roseateles asaccharophilus TaxID=582607 RepID=A0ABU2AEY1_9BURK|nr:HPP family protein [Roseateles asaccharophilus]MDR7335744.1 CBS-domain-containing membrane protein [Roseateles asaccharophilus]